MSNLSEQEYDRTITDGFRAVTQFAYKILPPEICIVNNYFVPRVTCLVADASATHSSLSNPMSNHAVCSLVLSTSTMQVGAKIHNISAGTSQSSLTNPIFSLDISSQLEAACLFQ